MKKIFFLSSTLLVTILVTSVSPIYAAENQSIIYDSYKISSVQPRKDILEWIYKTIDGKRYKRLWNASKGVWLTDWILVK